MSGPSAAAIRFASADQAGAAVAIWREVAAWMIARGEPLWTVEEFTVAGALQDVRAGRLVLGFEAGEPVAAFTAQDEDPLFWPDAQPGAAIYLHKLAVRRGAAPDGATGST